MRTIRKLLSVIWLWKGVLTLAFLFAVWLFHPFFYYPYFTYYGEFHDILHKFSKIPGVTVIDSGGLDDITFENIHVTTEIAGKGILKFESIGENDSFSTDGCTYISRIDNFKIRISGCDRSYENSKQLGPYSRYYMEMLEIGKHSDFSKELLGGMVNIPDAISRYDQLKALISSWPVCPNSFVKTTDAGWYRYCASPIDSNYWPGLVSGEPDLGEVCDPDGN